MLLLIVAALALGGSFAFLAYDMNRREARPSEISGTLSDRVIATLESRFAEEPDNIQFAVGLSDAYLQKIRETGDTSYYQKVEKILDTVAEFAPQNPQVSAKRAEIANGRHDFKKALELIEKAITRDSKTAYFYGIKSDAEIELGKYTEAEDSLQKMVDLKPNFSSFSRIAYQRELTGDPEGALEALAAAISAGSPNPENIAWAHVESGKLLLRNDRKRAEQYFLQALDLVPKYAPALEGLGRAAYAEGKNEEAREYFIEAFESLPLAQYATALGNFYMATGEEEKARREYALADIAYQDSKGVNVDLEYSLFLADYGDAKEALTLAQAAFEARPSIHGADALAWALYKNNRLDEAQARIRDALRLGEYDSSILFHTGMIAEAKGSATESRRYFEKARAIDQYASVSYSKILEEKLK